ncbi:hypothetical protein [Massilia endophytica]|uniref:hypothetical protein n=1 Tax=Massilia endophytica TaxID=2899220 RepID=UPI001E5C51F3|nr:hypothetical protein [Massilia endophytica]UGQ45244.1 hypothetical protein LSQ66_15755 [Massilia endophytica]
MQTIHHSTVVLRPGLYILRHPGRGGPLSIGRAAGDPAHCGTMEQLSTPGTHGAVLRGPQDCIVLQVATAPVELLVSAYGAEPAELRLDAIDLSPPRPALQVPAQGVSVVGYVDGAGEQVASGGALLGSTGDGGRLEGLQLLWPDRPEDVDLVCRITMEGKGHSPVVPSGRFLGSRGEGGRIVALSIGLAGPGAANYQLTGWAYFSGAYMLPVTSGAVLSGPTGLEHLTGIGVNVQAVLQEAKPAKAAKAAAKPRAKRKTKR